ncbi:MAG: O-antigen ligase family protein [Candidatus Wallbacteria bacterium]|nr:O-antigen ligase family protein [Candidatus Wallbacteria bacterium]
MANRNETAANATADLPPIAAQPLVYALFLLVPLVWSSAPAQPFLPVKTLLLTLAAAAAAAWHSSRLLDWGRALPANGGDLRLAALFLWALLSATVNFETALGVGVVVRALPFLAVFALLRASEEARRAAVQATLVAGAINAGVGLAQWFHVPLTLFGTGEEPIGLLGNRNHLAVWLAIAIPLAAWQPWRATPSASRRLRLLAALMMGVVLFLTTCRGAMLALVAAGYVLLAFGAARARGQRLGAALALVVGVCVAVGVWSQSPTARARLTAWSISARACLQRPVFGHGPGSFANTFQQLSEARFRGIDSDPARLAAGEWRTTRNHRELHNDWLQTIFELGFPAGFLLLFLVRATIAGAQAERAGALAAAAAVAVAGLTSFPLQTPATALLATAVLALALPGWNPRPRPKLDPLWPLWPKAWIAAACALVAAHAAMGYLSSAHLGAGQRLFAAGRLLDAEKALKRSLFHDSSNGPAVALLARVLEATGRREESLALFETAARLHLDCASAVNRAVVLQALGRKEQAMAVFRRAVAMAPADPDAWCMLGLALAGANQPVAAREALERAKELSVECYKAYLEAARLALSRGDSEAAERMLRENVTYLMARIGEEDPSFATVDALKRAYLALNVRELEKLLSAPAREPDRDALRHQVSPVFPRQEGAAPRRERAP